MHQTSVLSALVITEVDAAAEMGADVPSMLKEAGIDPEWLEDPDSRVPLASYLRFWELMVQQVEGLELGTRVGMLGVGGVGLAMRHGSTVREALDWLQRYSHVVHPDIGPSLELRTLPAGERIVMTHRVPPPFVALREPVYAYASALVGTMQRLSGRPVRASYVAFPLDRPADRARVEAFFACPVAWDAPVLEVAFDAALLDAEVPGADPRLFAYLTRRAEALTERLSVEETTSDKVRDEISRQLAVGEPRLRDVAARLAMSERTLHRRLAEEETRFASLVEEVRRERALQLLANRNVSCSEIAFMLGYGDATAFFRAFKRWTGVTPQEHRKQARTARRTSHTLERAG